MNRVFKSDVLLVVVGQRIGQFEQNGKIQIRSFYPAEPGSIPQKHFPRPVNQYFGHACGIQVFGYL